jgi:hypothetical protein
MDAFAPLVELPGVGEAVDEARAAVDLLRGHRVMRRRSEEVTAESALRGARASAALAGADWPLEEVRRRTDVGKEAGAAPLLGALRLSAETAALLDTWRVAPAQALTRMHTLATAGLVPEERVGRLRARDEPLAPDDAAHDAVLSGQISAPAPDEVAARLRLLSEHLLVDSKAPAVVVAGVVHGELLALRPFGLADGIVARAAFRLTLMSRGLDPKGLAAPEVGMYDTGVEAYHEALAGYLSGAADGVAAWLRYNAEVTTLGARESLTVCEALIRG